MDWGFFHGTRLGETYGEDYHNNPELLSKVEKNKEEIESLKKYGIKEPENISMIGDTGNDWEDE